MALQRDLYAWMHDQTLRWANHGLTPAEIAERLELPPELQAHGHTRGYYGDLVHNAKAVYQRYLSWYDGNPAHLKPHPPTETGSRYVEFMGGADELLRKAQSSYDAGDYRWVVQVVDHLVFADPTNAAARRLQADALEQLGYQQESATMRNAYLTGAHELRVGPPPARPSQIGGVAHALTVEQIFGLLAVRVRSEDVGGLAVRINWTFSDVDEQWVLRLSNRALTASRRRPEADAPTSVTTTLATLQQVLAGSTSIADAIGSRALSIDGDAGALAAVFGNLDRFVGGWAIVEP